MRSRSPSLFVRLASPDILMDGIQFGLQFGRIPPTFAFQDPFISCQDFLLCCSMYSSAAATCAEDKRSRTAIRSRCHSPRRSPRCHKP